MKSPAISPRLYRAGADYYHALLSSLRAAKRRIFLETMVLDQTGEMDDILTACQQARRRGVSVTLCFDMYAFWELFFTQGMAALRAFRARLKYLENLGVTIQIVGVHQLNPFAGRHHVKGVIIDDQIFVGGGVNLTGASFKTHDFMLRYDNAAMAHVLYELLPAKAHSRDEDAVLWADETMEVLLDAGLKGRSLIADRTCQLAAGATKVWYVSKLAPDGLLARILQERKTEYWYNSLSSADLFSKLAILIDQMKSRVTNNYHGSSLLHAKFCVFEQADGRLSAMTGSHNFNSRGVAFGTQELAIYTKDRAVCTELITFANELPRGA